MYDVDVRDYRLWMLELMPVYLILFDVSSRGMFWLDVQGYFGLVAGRHPRKGAKTVRVRIPDRQRVNRRFVALARSRKVDLHLECGHKVSQPTYARLDETLTSLGFRLREIRKQNKVYVHEPTGALIIYPELPADEAVLSRHLPQVRHVLDVYDILRPSELDARLLKAS